MKIPVNTIFSLRWSVQTDSGRDLGIDEIRLFTDLVEAETFKQLLKQEYGKLEMVCITTICEHRVCPAI